MPKLNLNKFDKGNLAEELKDGYTTIKFYDASYREKTKNEINQIWANVEKIAYNLVIQNKLKDGNALDT